MIYCPFAKLFLIKICASSHPETILEAGIGPEIFQKERSCEGSGYAKKIGINQKSVLSKSRFHHLIFFQAKDFSENWSTRY